MRVRKGSKVLKKLLEPVACKVDPVAGMMTHATGSYQKRFNDLEGLYGDAAGFQAMRSAWGDRIVYEVSEFRPTEKHGDLIFGMTRMVPGQVGDEFFMTRGHLHRQADRSEIYYGQSGNGLMLLESPEGATRIVEITPLTACYVPPFWITTLSPGREECGPAS